MSSKDQQSGRTAYRLIAVIGVVAGLALVPAVAAAQSPTDAQYGSTLDQISQGGGGGGEQPSSVPSSVESAESSDRVVGGLPFTGLDVGLLAAVAVGLAAAGLILHRRSRRPQSDSAG